MPRRVLWWLVYVCLCVSGGALFVVIPLVIVVVVVVAAAAAIVVVCYVRFFSCRRTTSVCVRVCVILQLIESCLYGCPDILHPDRSPPRSTADKSPSPHRKSTN